MAQFNLHLLVNVLKCIKLIIDGVLNVISDNEGANQ